MQGPSSFPNEARADFSRFLIVRLGSMGDVIHTLPAVTALRRRCPNAMLGWVIEERWAELLCALAYPRSGPRSKERPLIDKVHTVNTRTWRKLLLSVQTWEQIAAAVSELRAPRYEVVIDFQGAARSALIARWSNSGTIYGFAQPRENVATMLYGRKIIPKGAHIIEQNLSLAEAVAGQRLDGALTQFPKDENAERKIVKWLADSGIGDFVLLNPGAGWGAKQWPVERFGQVAESLASHGLGAIVNFGPGEESLAEAVVQASAGSAKALSCSIAELISLTRRASLFIGGDTGPLHLADALGIPVVAIFGPTNPARNGPFATRSIILRSPESSTSHSRRKEPDPGILQIKGDEVVSAARTLLRAQHG